MAKQGIAIIVLDIQKDIAALVGHLPEFQAMVSNVSRLLAWAREHKVPVIYSLIGFRADHVDAAPSHHAPPHMKEFLIQGTKGTEVIDELTPQPGDFVFFRRRVDSFYGTELEVILRGLKVDTLIHTGCSTARVVESTARGANDRDLTAVVVSDGTSAQLPELHEAALLTLADFFAQIKTTDEVIAAYS